MISLQVIDDEGTGEGWVDTHYYAPPTFTTDIHKVSLRMVE